MSDRNDNRDNAYQAQDDLQELDVKDATWFSPTGTEMSPEQWDDPAAKCLGVVLDGRARGQDRRHVLGDDLQVVGDRVLPGVVLPALPSLPPIPALPTLPPCPGWPTAKRTRPRSS